MPQQAGVAEGAEIPVRPASSKKTNTTGKTPRPFSKSLLIQESILIWILTFAFIILAFVCVSSGYTGSLPWLSVTLTGAWSAYGVSQAMYYNKSKAENTKGGIVYDTAFRSDLDTD